MSADARDVSLIQDEDLLRKMWQETEDFGRKKEIRSHMYKLREQRLREFYNNGENLSTEIHTKIAGKPSDKRTHADSLADHSFLSLKSKEIRDSESPTKDSYKISERHTDHGWTISFSDERSADGKRYTSSKLATKAGTERLDGGKIDYEAKNEHIASVYTDGDDRNFTKSVGAQSNSVLRQEAVTGDGNCNTRTSSMKTSSSSRVVTESKSSYDSGDFDITPVPVNHDSKSTSVTKKVYTNDAPADLKSHPAYVEGKTQIIRETKALPDGTVVTTTRYETKGINSKSESTSKYSTNVSSNKQHNVSSSSVYSSSHTTNERQLRDNKGTKYISEPREVQVEIPFETVHNITEKKIVHETVGGDDTNNQEVRRTSHHTTVSTHHIDNKNINNQKVVKEQVNESTVDDNFDTRSVRSVDSTRSDRNRKNIVTEKVHTIINKNLDNDNADIRFVINVDNSVNNRNVSVEEKNYQTDTNVKDVRNVTQDSGIKNVYSEKITNSETVTSENKYVPTQNGLTTYKITKTTYVQNEPAEYTTTKTKYIDNSNIKDQKEVISNTFINNEIVHEQNTRKKNTPETVSAQDKTAPKPDTPQKPRDESNTYRQPEKVQPIKPPSSQIDKPTKPTEGQYDTTYKTDYVNRKISSEVSPTHDAFARSLRSISPEKLPIKSSSPSMRSLRSSNHSLRKSNSPDRKKPTTNSPERQFRSKTPSKSVDKFSSTETITYKTKRPSPEKRPSAKSPSPARPLSNNIRDARRTENITTTRETITKKSNTVGSIDTTTLTRGKLREHSRSPSPISTIASEIEYIRNVNDVITDLDDETITTTKRNSETVKVVQTDHRPSTLEITTKKTRKVTDRSPTSPLTPNKDLIRKGSFKSPKETSDRQEPVKHYPPEERPLKRTDTYEERCRQILGLTETTQKRRGSIEKIISRKSSFRKDASSPSTETPKITPEKPQQKSPVKESPVREQNRPSEDIPQEKKSHLKPNDKLPSDRPKKAISEAPSTIRSSPGKEPRGTYPQKEQNITQTKESPSELRKSPGKEPTVSYPEKVTPSTKAREVSEYPSQDKRSPAKEVREIPVGKQIYPKEAPKIEEYPSVRRSPEKVPMKPQEQKTVQPKETTQLNEFPSQVRKPLVKEPLEPYPEKKSISKDAPQIEEFPSQIKRVPIKEALEPYPPKMVPPKEPSQLNEHPSQKRKSPAKETCTTTEDLTKIDKIHIKMEEESLLPEKKTPVKAPGKEPFIPHHETKTRVTSEIDDSVSKNKKILEKEHREHSEPETVPTKEFPNQDRKSPEKSTLEHPKKEPSKPKTVPAKETPQLAEFPSQVRKSPEKSKPDPYPKNNNFSEQVPVSDYFSEKTNTTKSVISSTVKKIPSKDLPEVSEIPSQKSGKEGPSSSLVKQSLLSEKPKTEEHPSLERQTPNKKTPVKEVPKRTSQKDIRNMDELLAPTKKDLVNTSIDEVTRTDKRIFKQTATNDKSFKDEESSSSSEDEVDNEEKIVKTKTTYTQNTVPVREPEITKKFISTLCNEDQVDKTDVTKKITQELLQEEIESQVIPASKMEKPRQQLESKKYTDIFIENEKTTIIKETTSRKVPVKKNITDINVKDQKNPTSRSSPKKTKTTDLVKTYNTKEKVTLMDIEKENLQTDGNTVHIRTHRVDDTIVKKPTQKPLLNGDIKTQKTKLPSDSKFKKSTEPTNTEPKTKKPVETAHTEPKYRKPTEPIRTEPKYKKPTEPSQKDPKFKKPSEPTPAEPKYKKPSEITHTESKYKKPTEITRTISNVKKPIESKPKGKPAEKTTIPTKHSTTIKTTVLNQQIKPKSPVEILKKNKPATNVITSKAFKVEDVKQKKTPTKTSVTIVVKKKPTTTKTLVKEDVRKTISKSKVTNDQYHDTDEEESIIDSLEGSDVELIENVTVDDGTSHINKTKQMKKKVTEIETRERKRSTDLMRKDRKSERRCITTKTIIINNQTNEEKDIIVDLQRSKSSREPTPDRICPVPLSSDEETPTAPRYPDNVVEPDDGNVFKKPKRLTDFSISETDVTTEYTNITEIPEMKVENISRETQELTEKSTVSRKTPIRTIDKSIISQERDDEEDVSILSVSDKVSKFITTAEQLISTDTSKSQKTHTEEIKSKVSDKIKQFTTKTNEPEKPKNFTPAARVSRPELTDVDETIKEDECMLSVSDKVSKFITTAEKLTTKNEVKKPVSLSKIVQETEITTSITSEKKPLKIQDNLRTKTPERVVSEKGKPQRFSPDKEILDGKLPDRRTPEKTSTSSPKKPSNRDEKTPERRPSATYSSIKTETQETRVSRKDKGPEYPDSTPKSGRRPSQEGTKTFLGTIGRLRSTESIKKAKELFENISKEQDKPKQRDILSRPSVFEGRRTDNSPQSTSPHLRNLPKKKLSYPEDEGTKETTQTNVTTRKTFTSDTNTIYNRHKSPEKTPQKNPLNKPKERDLGDSNVPHYMLPLDRRPHSPDQVRESLERTTEHNPREAQTEGKVPHYMTPLDRRPHSPSPDRDTRRTTETITEHKYRETHTDGSKEPHYMTPLDRDVHSPSPSRESRRRERVTEQYRRETHTDSDKVPHYMTPLERDVHNRSPSRDSKRNERVTVTENYHRETRRNSDKVPHYMTPLERDVHSPSPSREMRYTERVTEHRETIHNDKVPHYMTPLERDVHSPSPTRDSRRTERITDHSYRETYAENGEVPHYMTPLEKRHQSPSSERDIRRTTEYKQRDIESGKVPHYMTPIERRPQSPSPDGEPKKITELKYKETHTNTQTTEHKFKEIHSDESIVPHYMTPLDRRPNSLSPDRETKRTTEPRYKLTDGGKIPHYMTPLEKRPQSPSPERETRKTIEHKYKETYSDSGKVPHYMSPLDRRPHSPSPDRETERTTVHKYKETHTESGKIPHYMEPLERRPHSPSPDRETRRTTDNQYRESGKVPHYMTPLDRRPHSPSPDRQLSTSIDKFSETSVHKVREHSSQNGDIPHYMTPLDRRPHSPSVDKEHRTTPERGEKNPESHRRRTSSPSYDQPDVPHYMLPLERQHTENSPDNENVSHIKKSHHPTDTTDLKTKKFGVTLRRTDSNKATFTTTQSLTDKKKYVATIEKRLTEEEVEDIFDLEILEELLIRVVGYDLRKKIRSQIRLVKKLISENTLETYISSRQVSINKVKEDTKTTQIRKQDIKSPERHKEDKNHRHPSRTESKKDIEVTQYDSTHIRKTPERSITERTRQHSEITERRESTYSYDERRTSSDCTTTAKLSRRSQTPEKSSQKGTPRGVTPEKNIPSKISTEVKSSKTETKDTITKLKKAGAVSPKPAVVDDKPEWVKQRNLRKTSETSAPVGRKTTTSSKVSSTRSETVRRSPAKDIKPTDIITSSYGVGPTDENGTPLFGLKALRAQSKVQGTVITSEFHSENGQEPVGQISVTKYSSDPKDFGKNDETTKKGITSITTTQKFGYKDTPSLKTLTSSQKKITEDESTNTKTTKVTRRNSVKAISQKFIDNAVETLKNEKQTSYPKAGLILRTSSFKENGHQTVDQREDSPAERECESVTVRTTSSTKTVTGGETFLTNKSRVSGVKDVISRMKTEDKREGDTEEDVEARDLLNKFLGSQVILSGIESESSTTTTKESVSTTPTSSVKRTTKITTTVTEGGKPTTKTREFQRPVSQEELETIWDEQTLRLLLEQSTDYEERRLIRARLRQVMAEQEACTELVEKASQEQSSGALDGESLLLPLLQGLLQAPEKEQPSDSGVESGEDQRSNLIAEVQVALDKLAASLRDDATDITTERRSSLLQLVTKLQDGLAVTNPKLERRLSSGPGRFTKKRDRQSRHTVGVSSEELANARRLIEEISISDLTPSPSKNHITASIKKQNSEGSVINSNNNSTFNNKFSGRTAVKNATAKPFSSSSNSISNASSTIQTPTDAIDHLESPFGDDLNIQESTSNPLTHTNSSSSNYLEESKTSPLTQNIFDIDNIKSIHQAVQVAARKKVNSESMESEIEEDSSTLKGNEESEIIQITPTKLHENPIYNNTIEHSDPPKMSYEEKVSRFDTQSRKFRMKRANTIDIPKALQFYEDDASDSESETEEQKRKNTYYALRGPIRVGNPINKKTVPAFELKTKSDQKFLEFINKNNPDSNNQGSLWTQQNKTTVWSNKFGNIKNNFENKSSQNGSAKSFWKSQDDAAASIGGTPYFGPKISRRSARNLQQMFEERQKMSEERTLPNDKNIVTGHITVKTEPEKSYKCISQPNLVNQFSHAPQSAFKPIQKKIQAPQDNQFSQQFFKPIPQNHVQPLRETTITEPESPIIKTEVKEKKDEKPLYLYSPKPLFSPTESSPPIMSKPWVANRSDQSSRVLNIAAKKFEVPKQPETYPIKARKLSNDYNKIFNAQPSTPEKLTAPYLVKGTEQHNTVRKMSAEFETLGTKVPEYTSHSTVKYQANPAVSYMTQISGSENKPRLQQSTQPYRSPVAKMDNKIMKFEQPSQIGSVFSMNIPQNKQYAAHNQQQNLSYSQYQTNQPSTGYQSYNNTRDQVYSYNPQTYNRISSYENKPLSPIKPTVSPVDNFQPVNYSIRYDQPGILQNQQNETTPSPGQQQVFQHVPGKEIDQSPQEYTSTSSIQFNIKPQNSKLQDQNLQRDAPASHPPKLETQISSESIHEYNAISSKVMTGPVSQQAVTVRQKSPMNRDEHEMNAAFNLKNSLQQLSDGKTTNRSPSSSFKYKSQTSPNTSFKYKSSEPQFQVSDKHTNAEQSKFIKTTHNNSIITKENKEPVTQKYKNNFSEPFSIRGVGGPPENKAFGVVKPMQQKPVVQIPSAANTIYNNVSAVRKPQSHEIFEIHENGQSVITSKFHIPVINVAPSSPAALPTHSQILSKSDSWHQICQAANKPVLPSASSSNKGVMKSKSSHSLAVPSKQFEAGMSKEELMQKKRTIEAYFSGGSKSPHNEESRKNETKVVKRSINRLKTSEKLSAARQTSGLSRSRTLPDIVCPDLLDESNVDQSFEALFKAAS